MIELAPVHVAHSGSLVSYPGDPLRNEILGPRSKIK